MIHRILTLVAALIICQYTFAQQKDAIALTINGKPIYKAEIEDAYKKRNLQSIDGAKESVKDFTDSYVNFRLNVEEAKAQGLDKTDRYRRDYISRRYVLTGTFLKDTISEKKAVKKIYEYMSQDIEINHVLIPYTKKEILPADTLALLQKAMDMRQHVAKNGFVGDGFSDISKSRTIIFDRDSTNGYMGWITAFMLTKPVNDAAYTLPINEISMPIRSNRGYHIIQILNKRPAIGLVDLDQVVFGFTLIPPDQHQIDSVGQVVKEVYDDYRATGNYDAICQAYAEAFEQGEKGCDFGVIGLGNSQLPPVFISTAFSLQNSGDVSQPVITNYGYHIIRLKDKIAFPPFAQVEQSLRKSLREDLKRSAYLTDEWQKNQRTIYQYLPNNTTYQQLNLKMEGHHPLDSLFVDDLSKSNDLLFSIEGKKNVYVNQLGAYLRNQSLAAKNEDRMSQAFTQKPIIRGSQLSTDIFNDLLDDFISNQISQYAEETIESHYPQFDGIMAEYGESTLAFDVKNINVWEKAKKEEVKLSQFFEKNKSKYISTAHPSPTLKDVRNLVISDYQEELEKEWNANLRKKYAVKINRTVLQSIK